MMFVLFSLLSSLIACLKLKVALYDLYALVRRRRQNTSCSMLLSNGSQPAPQRNGPHM